MSYKPYVFPFVGYISLSIILGTVVDKQSAYIISLILTLSLILFFWKNYSLSHRISQKDVIYSIFAGLLIYFSWILLDGKYPLLSTLEIIEPANNLELFFRFIGFVIITPLIEELFTRGFLIRFAVHPEFKKIAIGHFTWFSFIVTVLFFGFSHAEWLQGLVAGILLNLLHYKTKKVETCIIAHSLVNLALIVL